MFFCSLKELTTMSPCQYATLWCKMTNKVEPIWADFLIRRWQCYTWARRLQSESPLFKNAVLSVPVDKKQVILETTGTFLSRDSSFKLKYFYPNHDLFTTLKCVFFFFCLNPTRLYEQRRGNITFSCQSDLLNEISRIIFKKTYKYCQQNFYFFFIIPVSLTFWENPGGKCSRLSLYSSFQQLSLLVYVTETAAVAVAVLCQAICLSQTD